MGSGRRHEAVATVLSIMSPSSPNPSYSQAFWCCNVSTSSLIPAFVPQTSSEQKYGNNKRITIWETIKLEKQKATISWKLRKHPTKTNIDFQWSKCIHLCLEGGKAYHLWGARPFMKAQQPIYTNIRLGYFLINFLLKCFSPLYVENNASQNSTQGRKSTI